MRIFNKCLGIFNIFLFCCIILIGTSAIVFVVFNTYIKEKEKCYIEENENENKSKSGMDSCWMDSSILNFFESKKDNGLVLKRYYHYCNMGMVIVRISDINSSTNINLINMETKLPVTCEEYPEYIKTFKNKTFKNKKPTTNKYIY